MVVPLDQDPDSFSSYLDKKIGFQNVTVALTADHGVAPIPTESAKRGAASARLDLDAFTAVIDESLNARFSPNKGVQYFMPTQELPYLALDPHAFGTVSERMPSRL
jgi:hypothetical protein